jgi:hypothetical protein
MMEIPDRQLEITMIIELLRRVELVRTSDPSEYNCCIFLAKKWLELLADDLIEQAKREGKELITELDLDRKIEEIEEPLHVMARIPLNTRE